MPTKLAARAKGLILTFLNSLHQKVLRQSDLHEIFIEHREAWRLPKVLTKYQFIELLVSEELLRKITLDATPYSPEVRYIRDDAGIFELALSLRPRSYLTHATALLLHGLVDKKPESVLINHEQSAKPPPAGISTQAAIDRAFSRPQRQSKLRLRCDLGEIVLLNGKATGRHGVKKMTGPNGEQLEVTGLERTLVDIVVRPAYAGGIEAIVEAFCGERPQAQRRARLARPLRGGRKGGGGSSGRDSRARSLQRMVPVLPSVRFATDANFGVRPCSRSGRVHGFLGSAGTVN